MDADATAPIIITDADLVCYTYVDDPNQQEPLLFDELAEYEAGDLDGVSRENANWGDDDQPHPHGQRPRGFSKRPRSFSNGHDVDDGDGIDGVDDGDVDAAALAAFADSIQLPHNDPDLPGMYRDYAAGTLH